MPLAPATRLGPYEIVAPLGAGGMGEVYRARDPRLGRDVAIKVLPTDFAQRPESLARFEREAQAVAALSHPNILAIHDVGTDNGISYAVMELLEGESMRQALARGPIPPRRAIDYAVQLAHGLAAAHDKGIVHRDLKPENVFITGVDHVKILDFGLARQEAPSQPGTVAATQPSPTEPGTVLGTVGYMAPEQVRGAVVDSRADIFSFGVILYEMVGGEPAFRRETSAETMTAILREDPPDLSPARGLPAGIEHIIRRCLEKKPESRFHSAHDLAFVLEALSGSSASISTPPVAEPSAARRGPRWLLPLAAAAAIATAGAAGVWYGRQQAGVAGAPGSIGTPVFRQLTFGDAIIETARFAPDGQTVVYSARQGRGATRLLLTRIEFPGATALPFESAVVLAVSPDAEMAVGLNPTPSSTMGSSALARVPLLGGAPRPVVEHVTFADWAPTGGDLAIVRVTGSQQRLEFPISRVLFQTEGEIGWPRVSPDGQHVAFFDYPVKNDDRGTLVIVDRAGTRLAVSEPWEALRGLAWAPSGGEVWFSASSGSSFDYTIMAFAPGQPVRRVFSAPGGVVLHDTTRDGKALVSRYDRAVRIEGSFAGEASTRDLSWLGGSFAQDITPDGSRILLSYFGRGSSPNYDVYVRRTSDAEATRIGEGQGQQFSPDGQSALAVVHGPPARLMILPIGPGDAKTVNTGAVTVTHARWLSADRLLIIGTEPGSAVRAYVTNVSGSTPRAITPEGITFNPSHLALSFDRRRIAFRASDGRILVYATSDGSATPALGFEPGERPIGWTVDDRRLLVLTGDSTRQLVAIDPSTGTRTIVRTFSTPDPTLLLSGFMQTPDGRSWVVNYQERRMTLFLAEGLR